jgi:hypothetical protein
MNTFYFILYFILISNLNADPLSYPHLPYYNLLGLGVDGSKGVEAGYLAQVMYVNVSDNQSDKQYNWPSLPSIFTIPDNSFFDISQLQNILPQISIFQSANDVQNEWNAGLNYNVNPGMYRFMGGMGFLDGYLIKDLISSLPLGNEIFLDQTQIYFTLYLYTRDPDTGNALVTSTFLQEVNRLSTNYNQTQYQSFINRYGTHFIVGFSYGVSCQLLASIEGCQYTDIDAIGLRDSMNSILNTGNLSSLPQEFNSYEYHYLNFTCQGITLGSWNLEILNKTIEELSIIQYMLAPVYLMIDNYTIALNMRRATVEYLQSQITFDSKTQCEDSIDNDDHLLLYISISFVGVCILSLVALVRSASQKNLARNIVK